MKKQGVLVVGSVNMDLVVNTERFPVPGETVFGKTFHMFPGGKGANQAVSCAKLGVPTTFIGKFGEDQFCEKLTSAMKKDGVDLSHTFIDKVGSTGIALITVNGLGQNEIIVISGSNMCLTPENVESKSNLFVNVNVVLAQLEIPLKSVWTTAELARKNGAIFILNPAPAQELPPALLELVDYLTPNETELEILSGIKIKSESDLQRAAEVILSKGVKNLIVTLGSEGAILFSENMTTKFPACELKVIDTTGAGDAFNGAVAYSLSNGKDIHEAIDFANMVAGISVTRTGAQSSMPDINEVIKYASINNLTEKIK